MEDFLRKELGEWYLHHVNLREGEERSQGRYFSWSDLEREGIYRNERRRELKEVMKE